MKVVDVILSLICGRIVGLVASDFLHGLNIRLGAYEHLIIWLAFPLLAVAFLWLASFARHKLLFIYQGAKHLLVGAVATVVDLKLFEFVGWLLGIAWSTSKSVKAISFIISVVIKYWGNKYWAFQKHEKEGARKEFLVLFLVTLLGLLIDLAAFDYIFQMGSWQAFSQIPKELWLKISVIAAALFAAVWNFVGYKFFVFKK